MPRAFAEVFVVSLPTTFEGVFCLLFLVCCIRANDIPGIIQTSWGAGKSSKVFSPLDKFHSGLRKKGYNTDSNILQQCQGHVSCMQKYK